MMKTGLSVDQIRDLDRRATEEYGIPSLLLMENAGRILAERARDLAGPALGNSTVWVMCGVGNNGGDGLVAARHLLQEKIPVKVIIVGDPAKFHGDAGTNYNIVQKLKIPGADFPQFEATARDTKKFRKIILLDAILGTGFKSPLSTLIQTAIGAINQLKAQNPNTVTVLACDIPSGLNGDSGPEGSVAVKADLTITFAAAKKGLLNIAAQEFVGKLEIVDIGIPEELLQSLAK